MFILRLKLRCGASLPWRIDTIDLSQKARAAAYQAAAGAGSGDAGDKDEEGSYSDSSGDVPVERTETLELSPATRKLLSPSSLAEVDRHYAPGQRRTTAKRYSTDEHDGDQVRCIFFA